MSEHNHRCNYLYFSVFHWKISVSYFIQIFVWIKTGCSLIDFDVFFFPMQSSEFTKSLSFESISKKTSKKEPYHFHFSHTNGFLKINKFLFYFNIGYILIDLNQIFPMKPSEYKNFQLWWNYWKLFELLRCRKTYSFQTMKDIDP